MAMKKFLNDPDNLVDELLSGFALAHADKVKLTESNLVVRAKAKARDKVALVTLGGSGHEPALSGYVGEGMLDISVPGEIFAAPGPPKLIEALRMAERPAGVLLIVLNHDGDVMSANMAMEMAQQEGLNVKQILTHEDISTGPRDKPEQRRGLVGCLAVIKVAGAAAEQGASLDECLEIADRMERNMATLAVAVTSATHPCTGEAISEIPQADMIIGMGQHGESGSAQSKLKTADETAEIMLDMLVEDLSIKKGDDVLLMINGVGSTTLMEQYVVLNSCKKILDSRKINMVRCAAGEFLTVQEMGGFQMFMARMDDELIKLWDAACKCPCMAI
ncbi:MAG: dihydroxyacetone kinase subunit DhaK [Sedimentisphaerales bacterium]|nr:dihydroxyacetone kinase subunit DhaK [Sedimentisphaerales bacterium]